VIDYTSKDVLQTLQSTRSAGQAYDLIVDCIGGTDLLDTTLLNPKGAYVTIVGDKTDVKTLGGPVTYLSSPAQIIRYIKGYFFGPRYACVSFLTDSAVLDKVVGLGERGELQIEIQEVIKGVMDEEIQGWKRAVELIESKRIRGKVVLSIS